MGKTNSKYGNTILTHVEKETYQKDQTQNEFYGDN